MGTKLTNVDVLSRLTAKQREALSLLIKHMTSKEISRELGISPYTVDQRIEGAMRALGVSTRRELAQVYSDLMRISEQLAYEPSGIDPTDVSTESSVQDQPAVGFMLSTSNGVEPLATDTQLDDFRVGPGLLNGPSAMLYRVLAILAIAALLVITLLGGITLYVSLSRMLSQ